MKIIIDTKTGEVKSQGKLFQELDEVKKTINNLSIDNTNLKKENKQLKAHLKKYE